MQVIDLSSPEMSGDSIVLKGRVVESLAKRDLMNAFMIPIDSAGNPCDTIKADVDIKYIDFDRHREFSYVRFRTSRRDSTYVFEVGCPGYTSQTLVYKVEKVGKRETEREMPLTILERAPHKLGEVQVVASKVKFYHRGDTLVYNADAFQLAEGSMLDELIRQLPGVELNRDGQIKVNGELVETLLLNGKHFFSSDRRLMLENLGAYTVKDVEVYRGQTAVEKWVGDPNAMKHLTMNVKLKKEYSIGYLLNLQAGYGTHDRYLGRVFASWFSPTANVSLVGNINNVSDNFAPRGVNDSWSSSMSGGGADSRYKTLGLNYDVESNDWKRTLHGSVTYSGSRNLSISNSNSASFYTDNQVYRYIYSGSLTRDFKINTTHDAMFDLGRVNLSGQVSGSYNNSDRYSSSLSASFNQEQADITSEALENIYGDASASALAALINRSRNLTDGDTRSADGSLSTTAIYKIPGTSDVIEMTLAGSYDTSRSNTWDEYRIDYGDKDMTPELRRQYTDASPDHTLSLDGALTYTARIGQVSLDLAYSCKYLNNKSDTYMYALHNLADMGEFGTLPPDYLSAFDPADSYMSKRREIRNSFSPDLRYNKTTADGQMINFSLSPEISFSNRRMDYWRDNKVYNIRHNSRLGESFSGSCYISYSRPIIHEGGRSSNTFTYQYSLRTQLPDMMSLVDIVDDTNPLYIRQGNPDLKSSCSHSHSLSWSIGRKVHNSIDLNYSYSTNSITRASVYDMETGVTRSRAENINGNNIVSLGDRIYFSFGRTGQFSFRSYTFGERNHSVEMMSTDGTEPAKNSADTWSVRQDIDLSWSFGRGNFLSVSCDALNRRTYSDRPNFNKINAFHVKYGLNGRFRLPAGFEVGTSLSVYTRRGYGSKELDTTDAIWNASASYAPKGKPWVFSLNAYDLLQQVSSVHYIVSATGRTSFYVNSLPSYVIATVQYRLNIQPKKRD